MSLKKYQPWTREGRQAERRFWPWETQGYKKAAHHTQYPMQKLGQASENRLWKLTEGGTNPAEGGSKLHALTFQQLAQTVGNFMFA